jgi:hypothetical protein
VIEIFEDKLVIQRKGALAFLAHGLSGEKSIPFSSITAVQFKKAGFTNGYIQLSVAGGVESGVWDATTDENTVMFTSANQAALLN